MVVFDAQNEECGHEQYRNISTFTVGHTGQGKCRNHPSARASCSPVVLPAGHMGKDRHSTHTARPSGPQWRRASFRSETVQNRDSDHLSTLRKAASGLRRCFWGMVRSKLEGTEKLELPIRKGSKVGFASSEGNDSY